MVQRYHFNPTTLTTLQSDRFVRRQSAQHSALLQFALCQGPGVLFQYLTVNIRFMLTIFTEGAGHPPTHTCGSQTHASSNR
jgi:hypothetical protein